MLLYLIVLLFAVVLFTGCSKAGESEPQRAHVSHLPKDFPEGLKRYVYPGAKVQKVFKGNNLQGITMRTEDALTPVAKFYLDRLGLPDDKVVSRQVVSYLYHRKDGDVMITLEGRGKGTNISISVLERR